MITREEVIEVCNKLGLVEYTSPDLEDYRPWKFSSSLFKTPTSSTIVVLAKDPDDKVTGARLYFYDKLKYLKRKKKQLLHQDLYRYRRKR